MQRGLTYLLIIFGLLPFQISPKFFSFYRAPWIKGWAGHTSSTVESELLLVIEYTTYMIVYNHHWCLCWNPETGVSFWAHECLKYLKKTFGFVFQIVELPLLFYPFCTNTGPQLWIFVCTTSSSVLRIRIRDPLPFWPMDPGLGMSNVRIRIRDEQPESYCICESLETIFWGLKYLNSLMRIRGSGMEKIRIRDGKNSDPGWKYSDLG